MRWSDKLKSFQVRDLWRDVLVALVVGLVLLVGQAAIDDRRSDRETAAGERMANEAERRDNLRFVRELSSSPSIGKPFRNIDLTNQTLAGLSLKGADLENARLSGTFSPFIDLSESNLKTSSLYQAVLIGANLEKADFRGSDLRGANLKEAKLAGAILDATCYDESTVWPNGFHPPASIGGFCDMHSGGGTVR